jgi:multiple sugar transport system permease protein
MKKRRFIPSYVITIIACGVAVFPFYWLFNTSLQPLKDLFAYPPKFVPKFGILGSYATYIKESPILRWLGNSFLVSAVATFFSTVLAIPGAYSISRFRYKGRALLIFLILLTQMLPFVLLIIPIYLIFARLHLNNTLYVLMIVYTAITVPIGLWFLKGFFDAIPKDLEDAAIIDGCSKFGALIRIILPLSLPGILATATWSFIVAWDEFLFAYTLIDTEKLWVVSVGLAAYIGQYSTPWNQIMSGAVLGTLPVVFMFMFFQRYLVSGLTAGSVKE